jgi:hypothetical protein
VSVRIRIENCAPGEIIDLTLALSPRGRGSLAAEVDPNTPVIAVAKTRSELAKLLRPSELPRPERREDGSVGAEVWARLLPWAVSEARAAGAFVIDQSGLPVAETPSLPLDRLDELAAHLCVIANAAETLAQAGFAAGATAVELDPWRLTTLRIPVAEGSWLALVLVGEDTPEAAVQREIIEEIRLFVAPLFPRQDCLDAAGRRRVQAVAAQHHRPLGVL